MISSVIELTISYFQVNDVRLCVPRVDWAWLSSWHLNRCWLLHIWFQLNRNHQSTHNRAKKLICSSIKKLQSKRESSNLENSFCHLNLLLKVLREVYRMDQDLNLCHRKDLHLTKLCMPLVDSVSSILKKFTNKNHLAKYRSLPPLCIFLSDVKYGIQ